MFIKAAILLEWTHLLVPHGTRNFFLWACYCIILVNSLLFIAIIFIANFVCIPRERIWHRWVPGRCIDVDAFNIVVSTLNLVIDVIMLLLPHKIIWGLFLSIRNKIGISFIFSVGLG